MCYGSLTAGPRFYLLLGSESSRGNRRGRFNNFYHPHMEARRRQFRMACASQTDEYKLFTRKISWLLRQPLQYLSDLSGKSSASAEAACSLIPATGNMRSNRDVNFCKKHEMSLDGEQRRDKKGLNLLNVDQKCIRHTL